MRHTVILLAAACTGASTGSDTGTATDSGATAPPAIGVEGDCEVVPGAAPAAGAREVLVEPYGYALAAGLKVERFEDEASYAAFLADAGLVGDPAEVDFAAETAVAVTYGAGSTCGLAIDGWDVWEAAATGGSPHVEVRVSDASWACQTVCDMTAAVALVIAVPRSAGSPVTACAKVGEGCDGGF